MERKTKNQLLIEYENASQNLYLELKTTNCFFDIRKLFLVLYLLNELSKFNE